MNHLLFRYTFARLLWAVSPIPAPPAGEWSDSLYTNIHWVLNLAEDKPQLAAQAQHVPWILWRIWKNRNELCFKDKEYTVEEVLRRAVEDTEEWQLRKQGENRANESSTRILTNEKWKPPPQCWVKCNTDAAWQSEGNRCSIGWALRNDKGTVIWMCARALPKVKNVLEAELEAMRWAVTSMSRFRYKKVIFESDAQSLINLINSDEEWPSLKPMLQDIRKTLCQFEEVKFMYVPRGANGVADRVARESLSMLSHDPKLYSIMPSWIKSIVELE